MIFIPVVKSLWVRAAEKASVGVRGFSHLLQRCYGESGVFWGKSGNLIQHLESYLYIHYVSKIHVEERSHYEQTIENA